MLEKVMEVLNAALETAEVEKKYLLDEVRSNQVEMKQLREAMERAKALDGERCGEINDLKAKVLKLTVAEEERMWLRQELDVAEREKKRAQQRLAQVEDELRRVQEALGEKSEQFENVWAALMDHAEEGTAGGGADAGREHGDASSAVK